MKSIPSKTFLIVILATCPARAERLLVETFDLPNGPLVTASNGAWITHSGTPGQITVESGRIRLSGSRTEDVRRTFTTNGVASGQLFAAMDVRFPGLPSPTGTFFFHFKDPADSGVASAFTGRIHVSTAGAWPGALRVGVAWGTGTPVFVARDIATNTQCRLVLRLDFATTNAVLWVNPASEADMQGSALATDARGVGQGLSQVAFRQATGLGEVEVDALRVGTRFEDVADAVPPLAGIERNAEGCRVWMPTSAWQGGWRVEAAGALRGPWVQGPEMTVEGSRAWALVPGNQPMLWFRLVRR